LILGATQRLLHLSQLAERADPYRDAQQVALDRVLGKLGICRHAAQLLHHVEAAEPRVDGDVATA